MDKKIAILVGGGPAPGINSVIGAATIRAINAGIEVVGINDGFQWISQGDINHITPLHTNNVSRIHFRGGSHIGISRYNPTKNNDDMGRVVDSLLRLNVDSLITIGGDDTAYSAYSVGKFATGQIKVVHVPKTIDNDLDLPPGIDTFGFQTARHVGVDIVKNIMVDANTTGRWYFIISMGRKAGHLAIGIGKAAGATLTLISEEFKEEKIKLSKIVDILTTAIIKRISMGRKDGVAIIAEGLVLRLDKEDIKRLAHAEHDEHGNLRIDEINFGDILKEQVLKRLSSLGIKTTIVAKNIGYELRCADPIPFDMEYTRDLGFCASQYLIDGGNNAIISIQGGKFVPIPFIDIMDTETGRMRVRMVDTDSEYFKIAKEYMIRLNKDDFKTAHETARLATYAHMTADEYKESFSYLTDGE
ncbi:MAG: diphosphate--fructose-6-phosphate 1-phosphotransferase [Nitrospinota bacterium]|nr:6-phosphofructokinase [Nitrospinota bacterium]